MPQFNQGAVTEIANSSDTVLAFRVDGHLDDDVSEALAEYVNECFDRHDDKVHLLFDLTHFKDSDSSAILKPDVLKSRFRALSNVGKYAVVGAPDAAERMIQAMDSVIPVDAQTFASDERDKAWEFVDAKPLVA